MTERARLVVFVVSPPAARGFAPLVDRPWPAFEGRVYAAADALSLARLAREDGASYGLYDMVVARTIVEVLGAGAVVNYAGAALAASAETAIVAAVADFDRAFSGKRPA
jgi:hypothetical protein